MSVVVPWKCFKFQLSPLSFSRLNMIRISLDLRRSGVPSHGPSNTPYIGWVAMVCLTLVGCHRGDTSSTLAPNTTSEATEPGTGAYGRSDPQAAEPHAVEGTRQASPEQGSTVQTQTASNVWFVDVTDEVGLEFIHQRGPTRYWLPEIMGGGATWIDYDNDGDSDLYLVQGGDLKTAASSEATAANVLYRNNGDGSFTDVTQAAKVGDRHYGMGATTCDLNGDGFLDLYVTNVGANVLYQNQGDGTFEEVSRSAGVANEGWSTASVAADYDLDGDLDLLVVNYIRWSPELEQDCRTNDNLSDYCSPITYQAPAMDVLYRNNGDGTFSDVTLVSGLRHAYGNGLGAVAADFNSDGKLDFYVANDGMPNQLWIQQPGGKFRDESLALGCAVNAVGAAEAGMGVVAFDLENDGDLDLFMTHLGRETNTLYVNQGSYFEDRTSVSQLAAPSFGYTGFGLVVVDLDHDGILDLFIGNGRVGRNDVALVDEDVFAEPNQLFRGIGGGRFVEVKNGGLSSPIIETTRAVAMADYDSDGDVDLLVVNNNGRARLLANRIGDNRPSLRYRLRDDAGRDAIGAMVGVEVAGEMHWRTVGPASGYLAGHEFEVHFGVSLPRGERKLQIVWPGGQRETRRVP